MLWHLLDGIAKHGARHLVGMLAEEVTEEIHGATFTHFAEHPTDGFVHEIVGMMEMDFGIAQTPRWVAHL